MHVSNDEDAVISLSGTFVNVPSNLITIQLRKSNYNKSKVLMFFQDQVRLISENKFLLKFGSSIKNIIVLASGSPVLILSCFTK